MGFIERSYALALENPEFLPRYLSIEKLTEAHQLYLNINSLAALSRQIGDFLKNMEIIAADADYTWTLVQNVEKSEVIAHVISIRNTMLIIGAICAAAGRYCRHYYRAFYYRSPNPRNQSGKAYR